MLEDVQFSNSITFIGEYAFDLCNNLKSISILGALRSWGELMKLSISSNFATPIQGMLYSIYCVQSLNNSNECMRGVEIYVRN